MWVDSFIAWFNGSWLVRVSLGMVGIVIITYPQWLPRLESMLGVHEEGWAYTWGWWKAGMEFKLERLRRWLSGE